MKICDFLKSASLQLRRMGVDSAQLDAELILAHVLNKSREWLLAHNDTVLQGETPQEVDGLVKRRSSGEPLAYITGKKEFYGREFIITPDVLIPRPETEQIIELLIPQTHPAKHGKVSLLSSQGDCLSSAPQSLLMAQPSRNDFGKLDASHTARAKLSDEDLLPSQSKRLPDDTDRFVACDGSAGCPARGPRENSFSWGEEYDVSETDGSEEKTVSREAVGFDEGEVRGSGDFRKTNILDVGTGSGVIAVTLALELPGARIFASDISESALKIARRNAEALGAEVEFIKSNLLQNICNKNFDIIVANLPYVAQEWEISPGATYEPEIALFADDGGLKFIKKLVWQASEYLNPNGVLILELDPRQMEIVKKYALEYGFRVIDERPFVLTLECCRVPEATE